MPILKVEKLADNYEYKLSMEQSYDRDGKVMKYEWCIDGNIATYSVSDIRFDIYKKAWQSGKAAYGGTYVMIIVPYYLNASFLCFCLSFGNLL